ncbi:hypothetical protein EEL32_25475 [Brevibacillus laterosporus]|nr:hypothetical protein [Brevibacillus laterosporus]TPG74010.1 hypothetical protein EEL32_25475 [Brevibacillus laterosporus]
MNLEQKRKVNALVANELGLRVVSGEIDNVNPVYSNGHRLKGMDFVGSWAWTGVLIEKAREQGVWLDHETWGDGFNVRAAKSYVGDNSAILLAQTEKRVQELPKWYAIIYLKAKGIDMTLEQTDV